MEQTPSQPGRSPELPSVAPSVERKGHESSLSPDTNNEHILERGERGGESVSVNEAAFAPAIPIPSTPSVTDDSAIVSTGGNDGASVVYPAVANDDDVIEKEWVEKAKKVLAETREDPYRREQEVTRLQADYLMKRYGRKLGSMQ